MNNSNNNNNKKLECTLETRLSKKGSVYECVVIKLNNNLEKVVFLEPAELEVLKLSK